MPPGRPLLIVTGHGEFLRHYDGNALPSDVIAKNVLAEKGVPQERLGDVLKTIVDGAKAVGFIREFGDKRYVDLAGGTPPQLTGADTTQPAVTPPAASPMTVPARSATGASPLASVGPGVHVNIEIHIAADASSQVVEDIFKNMRRYVLSTDAPDDGDGTAEEE